MAVVERVGEALARRLDRRRVVGRAAAAAFGAVAAWAVEGIGPTGALATHCAITSSDCRCRPPEGRFCSGSPCNGASSGNGCELYTGHYETGCWCTMTCDGGHYKCCDCRCGGTLCGCSAFVPDGSGGGSGRGKVTVCHKGRTKRVPRSALQGHLGHGDTEGPCKQ